MLDPALSVRHPVVTKMRIERFFLYKKNEVQFDTLLIKIDYKDKKDGGNIQNNHGKNLKKPERNSTKK